MKSNDRLRDSIDAAAAEQEQSQRLIASYAAMVRSGEATIETFQRKNHDAIREYLARNPAGGMTPQQFHAKQEAERRAYFRTRAAQGGKSHRVTQADHDCIVGRIFDSVDGGTKPTIRPMLEAHGRPTNRHYRTPPIAA
jgi:hypothetical protein